MNQPDICNGCGGILPPRAPLALCDECARGLLELGTPSESAASTKEEQKPTLFDNRNLRIVVQRVYGWILKDIYEGDTLIQAERWFEAPFKSWLPGYRIDDRWEILQTLKGGCGVVYVVYDNREDVQRAIKTYPEPDEKQVEEAINAKSLNAFQTLQDPEAVRRFVQEGVTWINLDAHPNVTRAFEIRDIHGKTFLFMEYVDGGDLASWIHTGRFVGNLPLVIQLALQFCDGMTHALSCGIQAHRDIKPANCLMSKCGVLKIADFGLAKVGPDTRAFLPMGQFDWAFHFLEKPTGPASDLPTSKSMHVRHRIEETQDGWAAGTRPYMAPEQFDGAGNVDVRSDVYSFGVMMFEMITGRLPLHARTWKDWAAVHKTQVPSSVDSGVSDVDEVVRVCLAKTPADRFANFKMLRARLESIYSKLTGHPAPEPIILDPLTAQGWRGKGLNLLRIDQFEGAIHCFEKALALGTNFTDFFFKGQAHCAMKQFEAALASYESAISLNPAFSEAWTEKGRVWRLREMCSPESDAESPSKLRRLKMFGFARHCFVTAIEINRKNALAWRLLANAWSDLSEMVVAEKALHMQAGGNKEALPSSEQSSPTTAKTCLKELQCLRYVVEFGPSDLMADDDILQNRIAQLQEYLAAHERMNKQQARGLTERALIHSETNGPSKAIPLVALALHYSPADSGARLLQAVLLRQIGNKTSALAALELVLALEPNHRLALLEKAGILLDLAKPDESLECYEQVLALDPRNPQAHYGKGMAHLLAGRYRDALPAFRSAERLEPKSQNAVTLGKLCISRLIDELGK